MNRSRLTKRLEKQSIKSLFLSVFGIIIIIAVIIKFGIPLLVNLSLFVSGTRNNQKAQVNNKASFVPTPILNTQKVATNSAQIQIEGSALPDQTIVLYVNGNLADKTPTSKSGDFSSIITLNPDKNVIKAKAITSDGKESELSESLIIIFKSASPTLDISSPSDNQPFAGDQNSIEVRGKTDPQVRITVNNFWAIIDEKNNFSYILTLKDGENEIKIVAQDQAGNKTEKSIKVTYSP
jgi:bacillopeptidase F